MKVASLLPAGTEILCAIGAVEVLSGVSHECDFPPFVSKLPSLTRSRLNTTGRSERIHKSMSALIEEALAVYEVDIPQLQALAPDVIITQDLCEVCAVSYKDVCLAVESLTGSRVQIVRLHPTRLDDVYGDIERVGEAVGYAGQAAMLVDDLKTRILRLGARVEALAKRSVLLVEWLQPVMIGGLWSADLAAVAGASALESQAGAHARTLDFDELKNLDPDVVVIKPCGFDLARTIEELPRFVDHFPWREWRAVQENRVYMVDGNAYFNRPGPRIVDSAEILAACVHDGLPDYRTRYAGGVRRVFANLAIGDFDD